MIVRNEKWKCKGCKEEITHTDPHLGDMLVCPVCNNRFVISGIITESNLKDNPKKIKGDFSGALLKMLMDIRAEVPHSDILRNWDANRGQDWYTGTKRRGNVNS